MRGNFCPFPVCRFVDLFKSPSLGVLYFVVDRVAGFASNVYLILNGDVNIHLFCGGALDFSFDSSTALDGRTCSLGERALNRDGALSYAALTRLETISLHFTFSCRSAPSSSFMPAICFIPLGKRITA